MGCTLMRRRKAGALHKSAVVFFVLNTSILESVRPVDHDVKDSASAKAEQNSSFVEVGANHLALANRSRNARGYMEDRSDAGWGRRRKEEAQKEQNADADPEEQEEQNAEGDGAKQKKKGGWGRRRREEQKEQNAGEGGDQQVEWQDLDGNLGGEDEEDFAGREINGVSGFNKQSGALPDDPALRDIQGSGEEVPLQHEEVLHRHGGLGDKTFSTVNGQLGSRELDILGEEADAPSDYNPKVAPLNDQGMPAVDGNPFYVNEREPELTHMNASMDTIHNDTEAEGVNIHQPGDLTSFGSAPKHGPGAATSRNHFRETLALRPRLHSAVDILKSNVGKIRTSARNFHTELDNSLIPLHQIHEKIKDVSTIAETLKGNLRDDNKKMANDVANPLDAWQEKGVYGESKGKKFAADAGQWNVFAKMLACHRK